MKTLPLSEVLKLATNSLLHADGSDLYDRDGNRLFVSTDFDKPRHGKECATAALLAHCWNTHDELIEAVDDLLAYIGPQGPCPSGCNCTLCSAQAVLAKAKTVVMP